MQDFKMPFSEKTASIGISFDVPNKKETIIIGSPEDVKRYYTTGILSENADLGHSLRQHLFDLWQ